MNTGNHYVFNGIRPDVAIPEYQGIKTQYWISYRHLLKTLKRELRGDAKRNELKRLVPELPLSYDRAIEVIDNKINDLNTNQENLNRLKVAITYIEEGDIPSALRKILNNKRGG